MNGSALTRRHALKVGGLGLLGLAMPQMLRAEALASAPFVTACAMIGTQSLPVRT